MYLSATEHDRLVVFMAAELARRTRARGQQLSAPEAIAVICDEMHAAARSGATYDDVVATGMAALTNDDVQDGVADLINEIRLEVLLGDGSRLIVLRDPLDQAPQVITRGTVTINQGRQSLTSRCHKSLAVAHSSGLALPVLVVEPTTLLRSKGS